MKNIDLRHYMACGRERGHDGSVLADWVAGVGIVIGFIAWAIWP